MKYSIFFVALGLIALGNTSCKKKSQNHNPPSLNGIFEFKGNGIHYILNGAVSARENISWAPGTVTFSAGIADSSLAVVGGLTNYFGPATYLFSGGDYLAFSGINGKTYFMASPGSPLAPFSHGQITISSDRVEANTRYAQGTFQGVAYASENDSLVITEGKFRDMDY